jgi:acid phosphatase
VKLIVSLVLLLAGTLATAQVPRFNHVVVVLEENHSYSRVIGNSAMPYLNHLASAYGLATNYYANTHPSIGNYFMLTLGGIYTNTDSFSGVIGGNNIVQQLLLAGKTWKAYVESLPYTGYTGADRYPYYKHHNPFAYMSDVINSSSEKLNMVSTDRLGSDLASGNLPNYAFVVPNARHDAHDCPYGSTCTDNQKLAAADSWLKAHIAPILSNPSFAASGVLVIVFDESTVGDSAHGGGHVAAVVVSSQSKLGFRSTVFHQGQALLHLACSALGLNSCPGAAATTAAPAEFFK